MKYLHALSAVLIVVATTTSFGEESLNSALHTSKLDFFALKPAPQQAADSQKDNLFNQNRARGEYIKEHGIGKKSEPTPIPISLSEMYASPSWVDWSSLSYGFSFARGQGVLPVVMLEMGRSYERYKVLLPDEKGLYDVKTPYEDLESRTFTRTMRTAHWGELMSYKSDLRGDEKHDFFTTARDLLLDDWHFAIGLYLKDLQTTAGAAQTTDIKGYYFGGVKTISPYTNIHFGYGVYESDGSIKFTQPVYGFTLDLAILGAIFGGGSK